MRMFVSVLTYLECKAFVPTQATNRAGKRSFPTSPEAEDSSAVAVTPSVEGYEEVSTGASQSEVWA